MSFVANSLDGVAILLWASSPDAPERLATPFFHAAAAAAMDSKVELYFSAASVKLLIPHIASSLRASDRVSKTIADNIDEAVGFGAQIFACSDALHAHGIQPEQLRPDCQRGGAVQFMARALDPRWRTMVF